MTLLELHFLAGIEGNLLSSTSMNYESTLRSPQVLMRQVELNAARIYSDAVQVIATYRDLAGDECILTESSAEEAVIAADDDDNRECRVLRVWLADGGKRDGATEGGSCSSKGKDDCGSENIGEILNIIVESAGELREDTLDLTAVLDKPELLVSCVNRLGHELLPAVKDSMLATYRDDDCEACILSASTAPDAITLAFGRGGEVRVCVSDPSIGKVAPAVSQAFAASEVISRTFRKPELGAEIGTRVVRQQLEEARPMLEEACQVAQDKDQVIVDLQMELATERMEAAAQIERHVAASGREREAAVAQVATMARHAEEMHKRLETQAAQKDAEAEASIREAVKQAEEMHLRDKLLVQQQAEEAASRAEEAERRSQEQVAEFRAAHALLESQISEARDAEARLARMKEEAAVVEMRFQSESEAAQVKMCEVAAQANKKVLAAEEASMEARSVAQAAAAQAAQAKQEACLLQERVSSLEADITHLQAELQAKAHDAGQWEVMRQDLQAELEEARRAASEAELYSRFLSKALAQARVKTQCEPKTSAVVVRCKHAFVDIEGGIEDPRAHGDVSRDFDQTLQKLGARQAFRIGRVRLAAAADGSHTRRESFPACYIVVVENNGQVAWPATSALVHASGEAFELWMLPLGSVEPGQRAEVEMDFRITRVAEPASSVATSMWVLRDAATSKPLGPVLIFEVQRVDASSV